MRHLAGLAGRGACAGARGLLVGGQGQGQRTPAAGLRLSRHLAASAAALRPSAAFDAAVARSKALDVGNDQKLELYGLFKQATAGPLDASRPSMFDM